MHLNHDHDVKIFLSQFKVNLYMLRWKSKKISQLFSLFDPLNKFLIRNRNNVTKNKIPNIDASWKMKSPILLPPLVMMRNYIQVNYSIYSKKIQ